MEKLKPCPFCGGKASLIKNECPDTGLRSPVISGIQVSREYIRALEWLPTWTFFGTW